MDFEKICLEKFKGKDWHAFGRRFLALLLACVLTFTSVPFTAFTEESESELLVETYQEDVVVLPEGEETELQADEVGLPEQVAELPDAEAIPEETEGPAPEETEASIPEETEEPTSGETEASIPEETEEPTSGETEASIPEETEEPTSGETEAPTPDETEEPVPEETEAPNTESTEEPEPSEDGEQEPQDTEETEITLENESDDLDITQDQERLNLELCDWWYENNENLLQTDDPHYVDYSNAEPGMPAGVSMQFKADDVKAGEYFTFRLPKQLGDICFDRPAEAHGVNCELLPVEDPDDGDYGCTDVKVTFLEDGSFEGTVFLGFTLYEQWGCFFSLWEESEETYWIAFPAVVAAAALGVDPESDPDWNRMISISVGKVTYESQKTDDETKGDDWSTVLQPKVFSDQRIKLTAYDASGKVIEKYYVQQAVSSDPLYLKFVHDGAGGGYFEILNVPNYKKDDKNVQVAYYELSVDTDDFPAYKCETITVPMFQDEQPVSAPFTAEEMKLTLENTQTITLKPEVNAGADSADFTYTVTFSDTPEAGKKPRVIEKEYTVSSSSETGLVIQVPVGLNYTIEQNTLDGYRFSGSYTVNGKPASSVTGTVTTDEDIVVSSLNYSQNVRKEFTVTWVDDGVTSARPKLSADKFALEYPVTEEKDGVNVTTWVRLDESNMGQFGLTQMPAFDDSGKTEGNYAFTGLPSTDISGNPVSFRVQMVDRQLPGTKKTYSAVEKYAEGDEVKEEPTGFVLSENMTFDATISWMDNNSTQTRPSITQVNQEGGMTIELYRRTKNGDYSTVTLSADDWKGYLTSSGDNWNISIPNLPRYDEKGNEYDYAIKTGELDDYKEYYTNPKGIYSSDAEYCHKGGNILEKIDMHTSFHGDVEKHTFEATKEWNDDTTENRGHPTVTLWRYSVTGDDATSSIDNAFAANRAAPVVYRYLEPAKKDEAGNVVTPETHKDVVLSYQLDGSMTTIRFDHSTVTELPTTFRLPMYDEQGRKYVYFVRETMDSDNYAQEYKGENASGAAYMETISNTRHEKAAVNVTVEWKAPANLADLNKTTAVKVEIEDKNGNPLTVYSPDIGSFEVLTGADRNAAVTVEGFNENIATLDLSFYVNIYDKDGKPIAMSDVVIKEITIIQEDEKGDKKEISVPYTGNEGSFQLGKDDFTSKWQYIKNEAKEDPEDGSMKEFSYKLTNTITGTREYTLVKKWDSSVKKEEFEDIVAVNFTLTRTSSDLSDSTKQPVTITVENHEENEPAPKVTNGGTDPESDGNVYWRSVLKGLPKYDEDGYAYLYEASEVSFTKYNENGDLVPIKLSDMPKGERWDVYTTRTVDQTTALNYHSKPGVPHMWISKTWVDNGDSAAHGTVHLRYYRKADVAAELAAMGDKTGTREINLDTLTSPYYQFSMTDGNNWTRDISLLTVEAEMQKKNANAFTQEEKDALKVEDYFVVEYKSTYPGETDISETSTTAEYSYDELYELATAEKYNVTGFLMNSGRQYETRSQVGSQSNSYVYITNTRIGQATLQIEKFWHDDGQNRPSVTFTILRDGFPLSGGTDAADVIEADGNEITIGKDELAQYLHEDGTITVQTKNGAATYTDGKENPTMVVTLENLDMYSEFGVPYTYNIVEGSVSGYVSEKGTTRVDPNYGNKPDSFRYTYPYTNTKTGTTVHAAYKKWNDAASKGDDRPDLVFTLWRYLEAEAKAKPDVPVQNLESYGQYTDKDPIMVPLKNAENDDQGSTSSIIPSYTHPENEEQYDFEVVIDGLPEFDGNGQRYVYFFQETMNSKKNGYAAYESSYERPEDNDQVDIFTNTLVGTTTFSGDKIWANLDDYQIATKDLPSPTMLLFRSKSAVTLTQADVDDALSEGYTGELVQILTASLSVDKDSYTFPSDDMTEDEIQDALDAGYLAIEMDENGIEKKDKDGNPVYALPKFDENGARYYYTVWEVLPNRIAEQLYTKVSESGTMTNFFRKDVNRRVIRVTKGWGNRDYLEGMDEDVYPTVTYTLYRYLERDRAEVEGTYPYIPTTDTDPYVKKIAVQTITPTHFKNETNYTEFNELLIYSPAGEAYKYFVVENAINGYTIKYFDEDGTESQTDFSSITSEPEQPEDKVVLEIDVADVKTENTYEDDIIINIQGSKSWDDYGNETSLSGTRPKAVELTLQRFTSISGDNVPKTTTLTLKTETEYTDRTEDEKTSNTYHIVWETNDAQNPDVWSYTIYDLEKYAPNGGLYTYVVKEVSGEDVVKNTGYKPTNGESKVTVGADDQSGETLTVNLPLANRYSGSYTVRKNWLDGNNAYGMRPESIDVALQRRVKATDTTPAGAWYYITWNAAYSPPLERVTLSDNTQVVGKTMTPNCVVPNTKDNSWEYTFDNLPVKMMQKGEMVDVEYRVVETKIGNVYMEKVVATLNADGTATYEDIFLKGYAASYKYKLEVCTATKTTLSNTLDSTKLRVTKTWTDEQNAYFSRPASLEFELQKRGYVVPTDPDAPIVEITDWSPVAVDGKPTFTVTAANGWTRLLENLPTAFPYTGMNSKGDQVTGVYYTAQFRAVEVHDQESSNVVKNAKNYIDLTNYSNNSDDHKRGQDESSSDIRNDLVILGNITVEKTWYRDADSSPAEAVFQLQCRVEGSQEAWHDFTDAAEEDPQKKNKVITTESASVVADGRFTYTWKNLPKYNLQGQELKYRVVEHAVNGYKTIGNELETDTIDGKTVYSVTPSETETTVDGEVRHNETYSFTNIELQDYTVKKNWINADYAQKENGKFTATFRLEQLIEGDTKPVDGVSVDNWTKVADSDITMSTGSPNDDSTKNDKLSHTWDALPKYTQDGVPITYRAVETFINGVEVRTVETEINGEKVKNDTNGSYIVTYTYGNVEKPAHAGTVTEATNRMVYGFVNLQKTAAYLKPAVESNYGTEDDPETRYLKNVTFNILDSKGDVYVSGVETNENGYLICNSDGSYGTEEKFLIAGIYTLEETGTNADFIQWANGIRFTVGVNGGNADTGEHGTAWIWTDSNMDLQKEYLHPANPAIHFAACGCKTPQTKENTPAYNLESRGILEFTKTDSQGSDIDPHTAASGENKALFGVYLDDKCTTENLVAYMAGDPNDGAKMVLKTQAPNAGYPAVIPGTLKNDIDLPYLRQGTDDSLSLLSGSYYVKELVAPAGYILDSNIRTATVPKLEENQTRPYSSNIGSFADAPTAAWKNPANQVQLYKRDQYGRPVELGDKYLVLSSTTAFMTGETSIRLCQTAPYFRKANGDSFGETEKKPNIKYSNGCWTIIGLLDAGKTYTISEPGAPEGYILAENFVFTMGQNGSITAENNSGDAKDNPLNAVGNDFHNYYHSSADKTNQVVLRDPARYRKNVVLEKADETEQTKKLGNIAFCLYVEVKENGQPVKKPVLPENVYLVTDANGKIDLASPDTIYVKKPNGKFVPAADEDRINQFTHCDLMYGLDIGTYYFEEIEYGASDTYQLLPEGTVKFTITPASPETVTTLEDYAQVKYDNTNTRVTQSGNTGTVTNTPVAGKLLLNLSKVNKDNPSQKLDGAEFTLAYTSINDAQPGAHKDITYTCRTKADGLLYLVNEYGNITNDLPDISKKGDYVLTETRAPDYYMTRTKNGEFTPVTLLTFSVGSDNKVDPQSVESFTGLVGVVKLDEESSTAYVSLDVTAQNEKTIVSVAKLSDILKTNATKSCNQENLNGEALSGAKLAIYKKDSEELVWANYAKQGTSFTDQTTATEWTLKGILVENTEYVLKEEGAPTGFMEADPIYFHIFGTTDGPNNSKISQLYADTKNILGNQKLAMVDEAIIAPVDLLKKVGDKILPGALFSVTSLDGNKSLGIAETDANGHLIWKSIESNAPSLGLIYNATGKRIISNTDSTVIGQTIILRQNGNGYQFTETYAPDEAYNDGGSYQVKITKQNYVAYKADTTNTKFVDIYAASGKSDKTTSLDSIYTDLVNPPYRSTVKLHKYDADEEASQKPIGGAVFTLYHATVDDDGNYVEGDPVTKDEVIAANEALVEETGSEYVKFKTGANGDLEITICLKGHYILKETEPAEGYANNSAASYPFTLADNADPSASTPTFGHGGTNKLDAKDTPNTRIMGSVSLTKKDAGTEAPLDGVVYTLTRTAILDGTKVSDGFLLNKPFDVITGFTYEAKKVGNIWTLERQNEEPTGNGVLKIIGLNWGKYELQERKELSGYKYSDKVHKFTITPDNVTENQVIDPDETGYVTNEKNVVTFLKIRDTDDGRFGSKNLEGAEFVVHKGTVDDCGSAQDTACVPFYLAKDATRTETIAVSDKDGKVTIYGLPTTPTESVPSSTDSGKTTYHLVETKAPKGYILQTEPIQFTIDRFGEVKIVDQTGPEVTMKNVPIQIYIGKIGESETEKLLGAEFKLVDVCSGADGCDGTFADEKNKSTTLQINSDTIVPGTDEIMIPIETVIGGHTYTLTETKAPDGYKCDAVVTFQVGVDGKVELKAMSGGYTGPDAKDETKQIFTATVDVATQTHIQISNEKIRLSLVKQDYDEKDVKLNDVVFELKPQGDSSKFAIPDENNSLTAPRQFTTEQDGMIVFPDGLLICGSTYLLTEMVPDEETNPNPSYRVANDPENRQVKVKVDEYGKISIEAKATADKMFDLLQPTEEADSVTVPTIVAKNEKIKLTIVKVDQATGKPLPGVILKLTKLGAGENGSDVPVALKNVSDADGQWETKGDCSVTFQANGTTEFTPGTYQLEEVDPILPDYNTIYGPLTITIDQHGKVTAASTCKTGGDKVDVPVNGTRVQNFLITNPSDGNPPDAKPGGIEVNVTNARNSTLQITKRAIGGEEKVLQDVEFKLVNETGSLVNTVKTNQNGIATFENLRDGIYYLTELKTAAGYNLLSDRLKITIDRNGETYLVDGKSGILTRQTGKDEDGKPLDGNILVMDVYNRKGLVLPATGSVTPQLPKAILGITAFLEGLVLFLYQRSTKRKRREAEF